MAFSSCHFGLLLQDLVEEGCGGWIVGLAEHRLDSRAVEMRLLDDQLQGTGIAVIQRPCVEEQPHFLEVRLDLEKYGIFKFLEAFPIVIDVQLSSPVTGNFL